MGRRKKQIRFKAIGSLKKWINETLKRSSGAEAKGRIKSQMKQVDFTDTLWLFASPWCEQQLESGGCEDKLTQAWVALWNYIVVPTSMDFADLSRVCNGLFEIPTTELVEILSKRKAVFFPEDNRIIQSYGVALSEDDFRIFVTFAEPGR